MAFLAAVLTQPRGGRFDAEGKPCRLEHQSPALTVLGTIALWTGWFFFNASGVRSFSDQSDSVRNDILREERCNGTLTEVACQFTCVSAPFG